MVQRVRLSRHQNDSGSAIPGANWRFDTILRRSGLVGPVPSRGHVTGASRCQVVSGQRNAEGGGPVRSRRDIWGDRAEARNKHQTVAIAPGRR